MRLFSFKPKNAEIKENTGVFIGIEVCVVADE